MKCIRCGKDSKYNERSNRKCPGCKGTFAFEPKDGDPVTDGLFKNAVDAVSGGGWIKWGVEHLYYEVNRRKRGRIFGPWVSYPMLAGAVVAIGVVGYMPAALPVGLPVAGILGFLSLRSLLASPFTSIHPTEFARLYDRWCAVHGVPKGVIQRSPEVEAAHRAGAVAVAGSGGAATPDAKPAAQDVPVEPDLADYSFDRAVICDRARTADLLIANNFHFENNCAILSIDGYPENVFFTVKAMIKRNPRIHVFTLHDATPAGCRLATEIAAAPDWFDGKLLVVDLGLRPRHAAAFHGLMQWARVEVPTGGGIDATEATWLSQQSLELAAVRPGDVLKRLFRGIQAHQNDDVSSGGTTNCGSFDSGHGGSQGDSADAPDSFG